MILLDASLRISVVAAIVALILTAMRVRAGGVRHAVWTVVLMAMLLMPILTSIAPTFAVAVPVAAPAVPAGMFVSHEISPEPAPSPLVRQDRTPSARMVGTVGSDRPVAGRTSRWPIASLAIAVPPSRGLEAYSFGLDQRLVNSLLKVGERETVAEFLERSAFLRPAEGERLQQDAAAIRAGKMPMSFQYMVSR